MGEELAVGQDIGQLALKVRRSHGSKVTARSEGCLKCA
jgi:hypothetical protein